jgi:hypothetical protein
MRLDSDSDTPKLTFKPIRFLTREEWEIATEKGNSAAAKSAIAQTPATTDGAKPKTLAKSEAKVESKAEDVSEPTKRTSKKNAEPAAKKDFADVINSWASDDDA